MKSLRRGQALAAGRLRPDRRRRDCGSSGAHLPPYEYATGFGRFEPAAGPASSCCTASRSTSCPGKSQQKSLTLVPLSIYFKDGRAKVEIALARGRRLYDKRHAIAERDAERGGPSRGDPRARAPTLRPSARRYPAWSRANNHQGGDRLRLRSSR